MAESYGRNGGTIDERVGYITKAGKGPSGGPFGGASNHIDSWKHLAWGF